PGTIQIDAGTYNVTGDISGSGLAFQSGNAGVNISAGKTWTLTGSNSISGIGLASGGGAFTGTLRNTGTLAVTGTVGINHGTVATLEVTNAATDTVNAGAAFSGAGTLDIDNAQFNVTDNVSATNVAMTSGFRGPTVTAGKTFTMSGTSSISAGTPISGSITN